MKRAMARLMFLAIPLSARLAHAAGLGVQGDTFFTNMITWLPTILFCAMLVGITAWLASSSDHNQGVLSGSVGLGTRGVIGGGALTLLAMFGFTQGALLQ